MSQRKKIGQLKQFENVLKIDEFESNNLEKLLESKDHMKFETFEDFTLDLREKIALNADRNKRILINVEYSKLKNDRERN